VSNDSKEKFIMGTLLMFGALIAMIGLIYGNGPMVFWGSIMFIIGGTVVFNPSHKSGSSGGSNSRECAYCGGSGVFLEAVATPAGPQKRSRRCPYCGGSGIR